MFIYKLGVLYEYITLTNGLTTHLILGDKNVSRYYKK